MSRLKPVLLPVVLVLALPGLCSAAQPPKPRPLNLSLPRDVLDAPTSRPLDENVERNLHAPVVSPDAGAGRRHELRYGAGYEHRHRQFEGAAGAATGGAAGGGMPPSGAGGSGAAGGGHKGR